MLARRREGEQQAEDAQRAEDADSLPQDAVLMACMRSAPSIQRPAAGPQANLRANTVRPKTVGAKSEPLRTRENKIR